jgi:hypothetical protein
VKRNPIKIDAAERALETIRIEKEKVARRREREDAELLRAERRAVHKMLDAGATWVGVSEHFGITSRQASTRYGSQARYRHHDSTACQVRRRDGIRAIAEKRSAA